jgi:hypothetical protein
MSPRSSVGILGLQAGEEVKDPVGVELKKPYRIALFINVNSMCARFFG